MTDLRLRLNFLKVTPRGAENDWDAERVNEGATHFVDD